MINQPFAYVVHMYIWFVHFCLLKNYFLRIVGPIIMHISRYSKKGLRKKLAVQTLFEKMLYLLELKIKTIFFYFYDSIIKSSFSFWSSLAYSYVIATNIFVIFIVPMIDVTVFLLIQWEISNNWLWYLLSVWQLDYMFKVYLRWLFVIFLGWMFTLQASWNDCCLQVFYTLWISQLFSFFLLPF